MCTALGTAIMSLPVNLCRACGVDVSKNKKNRHPLSGKDVCPTLTEFAIDAVKSIPSSHGREFLLDVREFQAGYVCRRCYRELVRLHTLEKQLSDAKEAISNKVAKAATHLPAKQVLQSKSADRNGTVLVTQVSRPETQSTSYQSPRSHRKRPGTVLPSSTERRKRIRLLEVTESVPTSSTASPDVAVSQSKQTHFVVYFVT